jgi:hypothetical protein
MLRMRLRASPAKKELKEKMRANSRKKPVTGTHTAQEFT